MPRTKPTGRTWITRCPDCKAHRRLERGELVEWWNNRPAVRCDCGRGVMVAKPLKGFVAKGHVCECSCGGANHGTAA